MKRYLFTISLIFLIALAMPLVSAAHYVVGIVNDARDGTLANEHTVVLWNPLEGLNDNLTDIIGVNGNSGIDNVYMIDCELLNTSCNIGNVLNLRVLNNGDNRVSEIVEVTIAGSGYDVFPEVTLNSPPNISLVSPIDNTNLSSSPILFNCSASDLDSNLKNITLYGNWSNGWHSNETLAISGESDYGIFTKQIPEGNYIWNCLVSDNLSSSSFFSNNFSFTIDETPPNISSIQLNQSYVCGDTNYVRVNCTAKDSFLNIGAVIIQAIKPDGTQNYSTQKIVDSYYSDILTDAVGVWKFNCIANDTFGNVANLTSLNFSVYSALPDLHISSDMINFNNYYPIENEEVNINATILNQGCGDASNFLVEFFNGDPYLGGTQLGLNKTISIVGFSNGSINLSFIPSIGISNIFVFADSNNSITEEDDNNNGANKTIFLRAWQQFFGNISLNKTISDSSSYNMVIWNNASRIEGDIFISNKESINWGDLQALGKNKTGGNSSNDFLNADALLGMSNFPDSLSNVYTQNGQINYFDNFSIFSRSILSVPVVNSTNNSNFITGILWETTRDSNGYFDQSDKEPLVFVTKVNAKKQGAYGVYDYEFKIPALLRSYNSTENLVYLYYDLV